ncbi:3-alpha,7-alpha,12-alpha-trihydroxy-5-beta-cholest-24-enoyl-CoA hydratase [Advenella sp. S44]|uniref:MaoC/PaaZ C-terminal domain-containing protein n=1 Tax=Advenella sp. S44 TaxID=1982755 RepID=UPI000C2AA4A4|nr:MaoC/PaaZ C-terminal domain-containing protein [Advenella sp. S44]PJX22270.1 3-alpha,7-alpha,12-alpha-trihydroxy-5-beta-cholest-24-enoyl-CoA hydratase [Advenella sp. S44]
MPLDYQRIKNWPFVDTRHRYTQRDSILYAVGIGLGSDPLDPFHLQFVYEKQLQAFPTMSSILCYPGFWMQDPATGINWVKLVHGEQRSTWHKPLAAEGVLTGKTHISHVIDKGPDKGALVVAERNMYDEDNTLVATIQQTTFCRADGGFGNGDATLAALPSMPQRRPDHQRRIPVAPNAAIVYRLNADPNPLHIDPQVATAAGFERPILHGLSTYGHVARAIVQDCCDNDPARLYRFDVRFSAPVYPGETLLCDIWQEGSAQIHFQARVKERNVTVLSHGYAALRRNP